MTSCGEELRDTRRVKAGLRETEGGSKPRPTGTNHDRVILMILGTVNETFPMYHCVNVQ